MRPLPSEDEARAHIAWRGAAVSAGLHIIGMALALAVSFQAPGIPHWPPLCSAGAGATLLLALLYWKRHVTAALGSAAFLFDTGVILGTLWIITREWAALPGPWTPFQPYKLSAVTVALLAPAEVWVGLVGIAGYCGLGLLQFHLFEPAIRSRLARNEPVALVAYGVFGIVLLVYRVRHLSLELKLHQRRAEARALGEVARTFVAMRDLSNTPLQVIMVNAALIKRKSPAMLPYVERIERALTVLQEGTELMSRYEAHVRWRAGDESFDPKELIKGTRED